MSCVSVLKNGGVNKGKAWWFALWVNPAVCLIDARTFFIKCTEVNQRVTFCLTASHNNSPSQALYYSSNLSVETHTAASVAQLIINSCNASDCAWMYFLMVELWLSYKAVPYFCCCFFFFCGAKINLSLLLDKPVSLPLFSAPPE